MDGPLGKSSINQNENLEWNFPLSVGPRPPLMDIISIHFLPPPFFLLQLNPTYIKRILHLASVKNVTFKSSYNWFKINNQRLVLPLTAILSPVQGHLNSYEYIIYYLYIKLKLCAKHILAVRE